MVFIIFLIFMEYKIILIKIKMKFSLNNSVIYVYQKKLIFYLYLVDMFVYVKNVQFNII